MFVINLADDNRHIQRVLNLCKCLEKNGFSCFVDIYQFSAFCIPAFRHIKVFVTYSADDKRHTQRVLNLCKCLEKNGFSCCVDIYHRKLAPEERAGWCQKRFEEVGIVM